MQEMTGNPFEELFNDFFLDARERIDRVEEILLGLKGAESHVIQGLFDTTKRELHTIKGNSGMMGLPDLQNLAHTLEDKVLILDRQEPQVEEILTGLDQFRRLLESKKGKDRYQENEVITPAAEEHSPSSDIQGSIRVAFTALDELVDLLAEMVIFRNRLTDAVVRGRTIGSSDDAWAEVDTAQLALGKTLTFIQERIMQLRMVPLQTLFRHLKRIVHDESAKEGKEIHFETSGGETPMDKALLEVASEALGHLIRNSVIHGIEPPHERIRKKKPGTGIISLSATTRANEVLIEVEDDGAGINKQELCKSASQRGIDVSATGDLYSLLFLPGFSTRAGADLSAGRGMGLYAALQSIKQLGGRIEVMSEEDSGSCFRLHLPLSVSITRAMLISADDEMYALPLSNIIESMHYFGSGGHMLNHAQVFRWRNKIIPVIDLGFSFATTFSPRENGYVIVIEADGKHRALVVDDIIGIREIVVKGLDSLVGRPLGIAGSTILGDGRVVLILDPSGLAALRPFVEESV
jgi:two-component system, chemotaxis family, sensor kinase CheA